MESHKRVMKREKKMVVGDKRPAEDTVKTCPLCSGSKHSVVTEYFRIKTPGHEMRECDCGAMYYAKEKSECR